LRSAIVSICTGDDARELWERFQITEENMHSDDRPTSYEARRRGERDFERGSWRNPYKGSWGDDGCPEAAREWDYAYRRAENREEERQAEEAAQARRGWQRQEEEAYYQQLEEEQMQAAYEQAQYDDQFTSVEEEQINAQYAAEQAELAREPNAPSPVPDNEQPF
jgi:hypothetical protein